MQLAVAFAAVLAVCTGFASAAQNQQGTKAASPQMSAKQLSGFVGQYRSDEDRDEVLSVALINGRLYVYSGRHPKSELTPKSAGLFVVEDTPVKFAFTGSGVGTTALQVDQGSDKISYIKIADRPEPSTFRPYTREEVMMPMRDGVKLHAVILRPEGPNQPLPFLMDRTPYGVDDYTSDSINARRPELAQAGYIFVGADIRGRYKSEGKFVMMRPLAPNHANPKNIDESTDCYDTVAWLLKNVPNNNGRVGVIGTSYDGFLTAMAGIDPHPAVKAISPQAPMTDVWLGDDFFHNGAFRETYGYDYVLGMESSKENAFSKLEKDGYDFFLEQGSYAAAARTGGILQLPTAQAFIANPTYDSYWRQRAVQPHLTSATVPTLEVGGYWDQEDMYGPQEEYAALKPHDTEHHVFLVLGPWNHGGWSGTGRRLADAVFGAPTSDEYRSQIEAPFFAHYLKDEAGFDLQDTASFQSGSNVWKRYSSWPPKDGFHQAAIYLAANGEVSFTKPAGASQSDPTSFAEYVSDPSNPIPYRKRPIQATYAPDSKWRTWLAQDQRFLGSRKDMASFSTPVLDHDVTITGELMADLFASTSGTDSDWVVKLVDVYPNDAALGKLSGYELMIAEEIFRGRYRTNFEHPEAITPNKVEEYKWSLHGADHVFKKGHKLLVQVQSSWFPLYDRNPQTFVPDIMTAAPGDFRSATERIYFGPAYPSRIEVEMPDTP